MVSVTVIGSGAVGKFYGGLFTLAGCHVCYLERSDFTILQEKKYYEIELPDGHVVKIRPSQIENDSLQLPKSDIIIIALKTTENHLLKKLLPPALKPESKILLLQNGIGNEEYVSAFIKNHSIVCGVTTIGVTRINSGYIKVKDLGELKLAPFTKGDESSCEYIRQQLVCANLSDALCSKIHLFENHRALRWSKLLWNTSFSSLSLVFNTSVDVLATQKHYQNIVKAIMHEVCVVAKADGVEIEKNIERLIQRTITLQGYYPSMYHDFKMGKPIESQYIVLHIIDHARSHHLNLPLLSLVYEKLMMLQKNGKWFSASDQEEICRQLEIKIQKLDELIGL
ncbi:MULTISPECIES: ketopantoate reductase family protein [Legionella]|uniref:2-dehydropantoate 2-reductase n=1 Tax=Legionella resiliens TaxID=2905958 RepID=A0ABS8X2N0_9GAMM|nr:MULTISPECIES: ketopantoate reductase family protein [unclassified Legionella]MCE0722848.1 ketopantoate reductase family protein [Legionella sp. 9fVS26]MCE3532001.1 ketopantoate reductase family protein [Legionella sp. 8cVS16]QLZ68119.1 2-dehydropantoate 2-reductase [Legionella sp. PC1000]